MNPITQSMVPSQMATRQNFPAPRQFSPSDWMWDINRTPELNWRPQTADQSDFNHFHNNEPAEDLNISMYGMDSNPEKIYGYTNYDLNMLAQEQTNAHTTAYQTQKVTRTSDNMNPFSSIMSAPSNRYPTNIWLNSYKGSQSRPRYN
jgi:hypothetical protein